MGAVMSIALRVAMIGAVVASLSGPSYAQRDERWLTTDPKVVEAVRALRAVIDLTSSSFLATKLCKIGNDKGWLDVLSAAEVRYEKCVAQDPGWAVMSQGLDKEREMARQEGVQGGAPYLLFIRSLMANQHEVDTTGIKAYCASEPWKLINDPGSLSTEELAAYKRDNPARNVEYDIRLISSMLALGKDIRWTDAPCDKLFWPPGFPPRKR